MESDMSNQEMQFADPDWKPSQQLDKKASQQEQEAYRPQPINADPREQQQWRAAQAAPPQQEGYTGLHPYAGVAPGQIQGRDYRQPQYRRRGRGPWLWIILAIILFSLMSGGFRSFNGFDRGRGAIEPLQDFKVSGQSTIVINGTDGAIHVVAGNSNNDVTIQAVRQNNFFGDPNDTQVNYNRNGDTITANVQGNGPGSVDLTVTVPQGTSLQLKTGSGDINIDGFSGQMNLATNSGDIQTSNDTLNSSSITTSSGNVTAIQDTLSGTSTITTSSGDITAKQTALNGQEAVSTSSGDINIDGTIGKGGSYQFQTYNGSVNLTVPDTSAFLVDASTTSGSIHAEDFPGVNVQGNKASGDIGGNSQGQGTKVTINTGSGDIHLQRQQ